MTAAPNAPLPVPLAGATFASMLGLGMMVPALPILTGGEPVAAAGLVSAFGIARVAAAVPAGILADRAGLRATGALGLALLVAGSVVGVMPLGYPGLVATTLLQGAGSSVFSTVAMTGLVLALGPERRGTAMTWFQAAILLAFSIGPVIGGLVIGLLGPRSPYAIQAVLGILAALVLPTLPLRPVQSGAPARSAGASPSGRLWTAGLVAGAAIGFSAFLARTVTGWTLVPAVAASQHAMSPDRLGLLIGLATLANFVLLPANARIVDGLGPTPSIVATTLAALAGLLLMAIVPAEWALWLGTTLVMAASGLALPAAGAVVLEGVAAGATGRTMGLFRMAGDVGLAVGPVVVTGLTRAFSLATPAGFTVTAGIVLGAGLVFAAARSGAAARGPLRT
ncbi:MFS transporter [Prosthecomicrobium sp. N25]|uniref:MFS transporter n=1 Tax=Prosthecomicrobium sp. N25 TaxID=3129254 RepID=UPI003076B271